MRRLSENVQCCSRCKHVERQSIPMEHWISQKSAERCIYPSVFFLRHAKSHIFLVCFSLLWPVAGIGAGWLSFVWWMFCFDWLDARVCAFRDPFRAFSRSGVVFSVCRIEIVAVGSSPSTDLPHRPAPTCKSLRIHSPKPTTHLPTPLALLPPRRIRMLFNNLHNIIRWRPRPPNRLLNNNRLPSRLSPRWRPLSRPATLDFNHFACCTARWRRPPPW